MATQNEAITQRVWLGILDADRYYRYYSKLAGKFRRRQTQLDVFVIVFTIAIGAALAAGFWGFVERLIVVSILIASIGALTMWQWRKEYGTKATVSVMVSTQYKILGGDLRRMWEEADNQTMLALLEERLTNIAAQYDLPLDEQLSKEAESETNRIVPSELLFTAHT